MSRTLPATVSTAIVQDNTHPRYLVRIGWSPETRVCTGGTNITWNSEVWTAASVSVRSMSQAGASLVFANGDGDGWDSLVLNQGVRDITCTVYEHATDTTVSPWATDAVAVLSGVLDDASISADNVTIGVLPLAIVRRFPPNAISAGVFTHLPITGQVIQVGGDKLTVS